MRRGCLGLGPCSAPTTIIQHYPQTPRTQDRAADHVHLLQENPGTGWILAASAQKLLETNYPGVPLEYTAARPGLIRQKAPLQGGFFIWQACSLKVIG